MNDTLNNKKRGRPRKFDAQKGIRVARTLFYQDGYTGLGVAKICQSMSITPTSLYAAYQSKYQLFEKVVDEYLDEFILDFSKALLEANDVPGVFRKSLEISVDFYTRKAEERGCLLFSCAVFPEDQQMIDLLSRKVSAIEQVLRSRFSQINAENGSELTNVIITLMRGLSNAARAGQTADEIYTTVEFLCMTFET